VPLIANILGVPLKVGALPVARRNQLLAKKESFWFGGVLGWGIGLSFLGALIALLLDERRFTIPEFFLALVLCSFVAAWVSSSADLTYSVKTK